MLSEYLKKSQGFFKWLVPFVLAIFLLFGCSAPEQSGVSGSSTQNISTAETNVTETNVKETNIAETAASEAAIQEPDIEGSYSGKEEVALYIHTFKKLPNNFITKKQAEKAGWISKEANLWDVAPGKSIGGSHFGNYEGQLPEKKDRTYKECDIDFDGGYRGGKRIIFSNDGLIFYTEDHYKTFEQLY